MPAIDKTSPNEAYTASRLTENVAVDAPKKNKVNSITSLTRDNIPKKTISHSHYYVLTNTSYVIKHLKGIAKYNHKAVVSKSIHVLYNKHGKLVKGLRKLHKNTIYRVIKLHRIGKHVYAEIMPKGKHAKHIFVNVKFLKFAK